LYVVAEPVAVFYRPHAAIFVHTNVQNVHNHKQRSTEPRKFRANYQVAVLNLAEQIAELAFIVVLGAANRFLNPTVNLDAIALGEPVDFIPLILHRLLVAADANITIIHFLQPPVTINCSTGERSVYVKQNSVTVPFATSDSWTILSPIEQRIKAKIEAVGTPLRDWDIRINYGIKTGCNEAFIIDGATRARLIAADPKSAEIIRPILRGRDIGRYAYSFANQYLIASHNGYRDDNGNEVPPININDYPVIKAHLDGFWDIISVRTDKGVTPYNLRNCAYMDDFSKQKIVWADIMRITKSESDKFPRFALIKHEFVLSNTAYFLVGTDIEWLLDVLNSEIASYFFLSLVSTFDNGGLRMFRQFIEEFPVPKKNVSLSLPDIYGFSSNEKKYISDFVKRRIAEIQNR
jgi:hypothetical protein